MKTFTSKLALMVLTLLGSMMSAVKACSCVAGQTFQEQVDQSQNLDALYVFGQINVVNGVFAGFVDPNVPVTDINADIYFLAYNWKSWKGCNANVGSYEYLRTGGNSAACGVTFTPGWYALASFDDSVDPFTQTGTEGFKRVGLCDINIPWSSLTSEQYQTFEDIPPTACPAP